MEGQRLREEEEEEVEGAEAEMELEQERKDQDLAGFSTRYFWDHDAEECQSLPLTLSHPNP